MRVALCVLAMVAMTFASAVAPPAPPAPKPKTVERLERIERWMQTVDVQIMALGIDGFSDQFTADYVATRSHNTSLAAQMRRFRAQIGLAIAESLPETNELLVCPPESIDASAVKAVVAELKTRGFHMSWIKVAHGRAPGIDGCVFVELPALRSVPGPDPEADQTINADD